MHVIKVLDKLIYFLTNNKVDVKELDNFRIGLISLFLTSIMLWSYTLSIHFGVHDYYHLRTLGWIYASIHLLSIFLLRVKPSIRVVLHVAIGAGYCYQIHYSLATGGVLTSAPIWLAILPLAAGLTTGKRDLFIWFILCWGAILTMIALYDSPFIGNNYHSYGQIWGQVNMTLGIILVNTLLVVFYIDFRDRKNQLIEEQNDSIHSLLRIIIHDINNPLTVIQLGSNLLQLKARDLSDDLKEAINQNLVATKNIQDIINHTKKMEAFSSGKLKLKMEEVGLIETIEDSIATFKFKAGKKDVEIKFTPPEKEVFVQADLICLEHQVINNVLSNALKFTPRGGVITIQLVHNETGVDILIEDKGVGIPQEKIPQLFDQSEKTTTPGTEGEKGTGFGLPILKTIMDQMNAQVIILSKHIDQYPHDHGTTFILRFNSPYPPKGA